MAVNMLITKILYLHLEIGKSQSFFIIKNRVTFCLSFRDGGLFNLSTWNWNIKNNLLLLYFTSLYFKKVNLYLLLVQGWKQKFLYTFTYFVVQQQKKSTFHSPVEVFQLYVQQPKELPICHCFPYISDFPSPKLKVNYSMISFMKFATSCNNKRNNL